MMNRRPGNDAPRMTDNESDFSLLSSLKVDFPTIPLPIMLKVINKCHRDQDSCRQYLEKEKANYPDTSEGHCPSQASTSSGINDTPSISTRMKELTVSHEPSSNKPVLPERHVSTIERSLPGVNRPVIEPKKNVVGQSISWKVQPPSTPPSHNVRQQAAAITTPQTAPADFSPFFKETKSPTDIPNITCKTSTGGGQQHPAVPSRSTRQVSVPADPASVVTNSPKERRIKVITIPPGSSSGGSVSSAGMLPNSRHIRMHFGDTGGTCTVQANQPGMQRYGSTPNISQHYRSEIRTETSAAHPLHSSSIVVNTSPHGNLSASDRPASGSSSDFSQFVPSSATSEFQPFSSTSAHTTIAGKPLSTPVQASSPGVSQSRPMFVEPSQNYSDPRYPPTGYYSRSSMENIPVSIASQSYGPYEPQVGMNYISEVSPELMGHRGYGVAPTQLNHPNLAHITQSQHQQQLPGYPSPQTTLYRSSSEFEPSYPPAIGFPGLTAGAIARTGLGSSPSQQNHFNQYSQYSPHMMTGPPGHLNHGMAPAHGLAGRTNSQDSDQNMGVGMHSDYDSLRGVNHYLGGVSSRVSSQSSVGSDSSVRGDIMERPHSGGTPGDTDAEYIRALLQHQRSRMEKMREDTESQQRLLTDLRNEVSELEKSMNDSRKGKWALAPSEDISKLLENNRQLQTAIQKFSNELDMYKNGQIPYNQINPMEQQNFFENMPTGQQDPTYVRSQDVNHTNTTSPRRPCIPPRPPPPVPARQRSTELNPGNVGGLSGSDLINRVPPVPHAQPTINSGDSEEGEHWNCSTCTFSNHPALKKCEMCEMSRSMAPPPRPLPHLGPAPPHHPNSLPQRLAPGFVSHPQQSSGSPAPPFGYPTHRHRAGS